MKIKPPSDGSFPYIDLRRCAGLPALVILLSVHSVALACRYNVRDTGFVDQGNSQYLATVMGDEDELTKIRELAEDIAGESNLVFRPGESQPGEVSTGSRSAPSIQLRSPDDRRQTISKGDAMSLDQWVASLVDSPWRTDLIERLLGCHSIVLIVEGEDDGLNQRARTVALETIEEVQKSSALWPKPIDRPAELLTLSLEDREMEQLLLWSWEMDSKDQGTQMAVLFGRGRRLGPILTVDEAAEGMLERLLTVVSMDCECEYDIGPLIGPMIPHRWTVKHEKTAVDLLGFDPGHPLVQSEVRHILQRGPGQGADDGNILPLTSDEPLLGYQEIVLPELPGATNQSENREGDDGPSQMPEDIRPEISELELPTEELAEEAEIAPSEVNGLTESRQIEEASPGEDFATDSVSTSGSTSGIWLTLGIVAFAALAGCGWILMRGVH